MPKLNFCRQYNLMTELRKKARFFHLSMAVSGEVDPVSGLSIDLRDLDGAAEALQKKLQKLKLQDEAEIFSIFLSLVAFLDRIDRLELFDVELNQTWIWSRSSGQVSYRASKYLQLETSSKSELKMLELESTQKNLIDDFLRLQSYRSLDELKANLESQTKDQSAAREILRTGVPLFTLRQCDLLTGTSDWLEA